MEMMGIFMILKAVLLHKHNPKLQANKLVFTSVMITDMWEKTSCYSGKHACKLAVQILCEPMTQYT